jgi:hypothetical protein
VIIEKISNMEKVRKYGKMGVFLKEDLLMIKKMDME